MSAKKTGLGTNRPLGRRLEALGLKERHIEEGGMRQQVVAEIAVTAIVPNPKQPRKIFDEEALQALAASIRQVGLIQPVVVQKQKDGTYELIAGERRLRAAKLCGLTVIPAIVQTYEPDAAAEITLIENLQREDLDAIEEAAAYDMLVRDFDMTQEQVAEKVGKSRPHVANMIRLLQLPLEIQQYISEGILTMGQVRPLLQLPSKDRQLQAAERIIQQGLSARQAERLVKQLMEGSPTTGQPAADVYLESVQDKMKMYLGTSVSIRLGRNKKKGRIEISFTSEEEFERLLAMLTDEPENTPSPSVSSFHV